MTPRIFLTGATGYIGGSILYTISHAHPSWQWSCLLRNKEKGAEIAATFPNVHLCHGDIDSLSLIEEEASKADIVIHSASSDEHAASTTAIIRGLARREGSGYGYYIHTGGYFALAGESVKTGRWGERFDIVYSDWEGIDQLTSLPDHAPHRHVDKIVLAADSAKVRTAIVAPSVVYGLGQGLGKTSGPIPSCLKVFWEDKKVFTLGKGENVWHNIHVQDLSRLYLLLAEAAAAGGGNATWNTEGYYLAENGSYVAKEMLQSVADIAYERSLVTSREVEHPNIEACENMEQWLKVMFGADAQGKAVRARKLLGWTPDRPSFEDELKDEMQR